MSTSLPVRVIGVAVSSITGRVCGIATGVLLFAVTSIVMVYSVGSSLMPKLSVPPLSRTRKVKLA